MHIRQADFNIDRASIAKIRFKVFVKEQHVPADIEMDDRDPFCIHLLAFDADSVVGTCRIDIEKLGKIGRLAVIDTSRNHGIGTALMETIHDIAKFHSLTKVWCHAQLSVVPFYEKLGYKTISDPFFEANIEHVKMEKEI